MYKYIDIGINLSHRDFERDRQQIMDEAAAAGVEKMVVTGTSLRASKQAAELAGKHPGRLYSTAGVHPHDAKTCDSSTLPRLEQLLALPHVVAVGECGLDYDRDFSPREVQREWFGKQIQLAEDLNMPLFLHERAAFMDFYAMLKAHPDVCARSVVHCFTGTMKELRAYLDLGCSIGITGWICDERRGKELQAAVKFIPLDRLMLETDAPYLLPRNLNPRPKTRRNEPKHMPHIAAEVAKHMGKPLQEVAAAAWENALSFFGIAEDDGGQI